MSTELIFRLAQTSDLDEILILSEGVYDGQDYLPVRFHNWMQMDLLLDWFSARLLTMEEQQFDRPPGHYWSFMVRVFTNGYQKQ